MPPLSSCAPLPFTAFPTPTFTPPPTPALRIAVIGMTHGR
jgi:hypothetical protein